MSTSTEPKRRYAVAALEGGRLRYFASQQAAVSFAASQARQSLTSPQWSVRDRSRNAQWMRLLVDGAGTIVSRVM